VTVAEDSTGSREARTLPQVRISLTRRVRGAPQRADVTANRARRDGHRDGHPGRRRRQHQVISEGIADQLGVVTASVECPDEVLIEAVTERP